MTLKLSQHQSKNPVINKFDPTSILEWMINFTNDLNVHLQNTAELRENIFQECQKEFSNFRSQLAQRTNITYNAALTETEYKRIKNKLPKELYPFLKLDKKLNKDRYLKLSEIAKTYPEETNIVLNYRIWNQHETSSNSVHVSTINPHYLDKLDWFIPSCPIKHLFTCNNCYQITTVHYLNHLAVSRYPCKNCNIDMSASYSNPSYNTSMHNTVDANHFQKNGITHTPTEEELLSFIATEAHIDFERTFNAQPSDAIMQLYFSSVAVDNFLNFLSDSANQLLSEKEHFHNTRLFHTQKLKFNHGYTVEILYKLERLNIEYTKNVIDTHPNTKTTLITFVNNNIDDTHYDDVIYLDNPQDRTDIAQALFNLDFSKHCYIKIDSHNDTYRDYPAFVSQELCEALLFALKNKATVTFL